MLDSISHLEDINSINNHLYQHSTLFELSGSLRLVRSLTDRDKVIKQTTNWCLFGKTRPAIEATKEGLKTLGVLDQIVTHPLIFEPLFTHRAEKLTADKLNNLFEIVRSPPGGNKYQSEDLLLSFWNDLLLDIEESESELTLETVLSFATGCTQVPPLGFAPFVPSIAFLHDPESDGVKSKFPKANTCALKLYLPVEHDKYVDFKQAVEFGIMNTKGFGYC